MPLTGDDLEAIARAVANAIVPRIEALERRPRGLRYCGVWRSDQRYVADDVTTHDGSMWHCRAPTREKPGHGDSWTLCVKRGKDGRDMR
jgi:hypothetical protein